MQTHKESAIISAETPLIANLDMCENIALIKEVHDNMSTVDAESLAVEILSVLGLKKISRKRVASCTKEEQFLVMCIRAMMTQEKSVMIKLPGEILGSLLHIQKLIQSMKKLNNGKEIFILDSLNHKKHYEGCECNIEK